MSGSVISKPYPEVEPIRSPIMYVPTSPLFTQKESRMPPVPSVPFQVERQVKDDTWQALIAWDMKSHVVGGFSSRGPDLLSSLKILTGSVPALSSYQLWFWMIYTYH
ncbi:hypothetical protein M0R45_016722 [Rubus argutus]|uniref:Uncharacterized protein n=1 Tax=Rubus argutus TaxID=59490 RepID=A0AAW1XTA6_RUBAR